jgi:hypothetical protein
MKTNASKVRPNRLVKSQQPKFSSLEEFRAAEAQRFDKVFGKVDWEQARRDGLIR